MRRHSSVKLLLLIWKEFHRSTGIVAIVGTDKGIAEVPGVFGKEVVAYSKAHRTQIFDCKDCRGSGVALSEGVNLPDTGNKLGKVPDHLCVIEVLVAELFFYIEIVLQSPFDFRETHIEDRFTMQYPLFLGNVAVAESSCELDDAFKNTPVDGCQAGGGEGESLFVEQLGYVS